ncbi:MAG: hypothetical protein IJK51_06415 [Bacteroidaceae bacterium]|nr:hypothetical protein [Bacteroidaceae bacterium]
MKRIILSFLLLLAPCSLLLINAQQQQRGKFNPQEFKAKLEAYVTAEAGFTQSEAQVFYPIYFEMKGKQRGLQRQIFQLKKNAPQAGDDKDYTIIIQKIKDLGVEMAKLEVNYYKKMYAVVSPQKVYKAMCAEDKFHRKMLEGFGQDKHDRKGQGPKQNN